MLIFAHIFAGALLGLGFWNLTNDRRAVPFCILGSILPDLIDKSLALLFPSVLGEGRTVFHALMIVIIIFLCILIFFRSVSRWLGAGVACAILFHHVFDEMWTLPTTWFYPLLGPFQGHLIPDYIGTYFWYEITNPSEWMFVIGSVMILAQSYHYLPVIPHIRRSDFLKTGTYKFFAVVFLGIGIYLVVAGFTSTTATVLTPNYDKVLTVIAGMIAVCGAFVMNWEKAYNPQRIAP